MRKYGDNLNKTNFAEKLTYSQQCYANAIMKTEKIFENTKYYPNPKIDINTNLNNTFESITAEWKNNNSFVSIIIDFNENKIEYLKCWGDINHEIETGIINNLNEINRLLDWLYNKE